KAHPGSRDPSDPVRSQLAVVDHGLIFAEYSEAWGGGVAFLDPEPESGLTYVRLYDLTAQQFEDIVAQENGQQPGAINIGWPDVWSKSASNVPGDSWYSLVIYLGEYLELPIVGFTCPDAMKDWKNPGPAYVNTILNGLLESELEESRAFAYGKTWSADT